MIWQCKDKQKNFFIFWIPFLSPSLSGQTITGIDNNPTILGLDYAQKKKKMFGMKDK